MGNKQSKTPDKNLFTSPAILLAGIILITFLVYVPSLKNGFTNWDDNRYIHENALITSLATDNIKNIFSTDNPIALNYHPITVLSYAIDYKLAKYKPSQYHLTNLLFHLLNTALVFVFIYLLSNKKIVVSSIVALFFGIHPMHVESVAWISERKDVLYVLFFIAGLITYLRYIVASGKNQLLLYSLTLLLFLLSVLSKAMAVVFPILLLLIDYYKGRKIDLKSLAEKFPFFIFSTYFGILATQIQSAGGAVTETYSFLERTAFGCYGLINYVVRLVAPVQLSCFYPYPNISNGLPLIYPASVVAVLLLTVFVIWKFRTNKDVLFGTLFFISTIILVLQFISVGKVIMADRYSYLAYIGLLFPIAMRFDSLQNETDEKLNSLKKISTGILIFLTIIFCYLTFQRCKVWENSDTLWTDAIDKYPSCDAYHSRASYLVNKTSIDIDKTNIKNEYERSLSDYTNAIQLNPKLAEAHIGRGNIYSILEKYELALTDYSAAIALNANDADIYFNRAGTYTLMKQYTQAINDYTKALSLNSSFITARENRSRVYVSANNFEAAINDLDTLIQLNPQQADYYFYRSFSLSKTGNYEQALIDNTKAIQLNSNNALWYLSRSYIYYHLGQFKNAFDDVQTAIQRGEVVDENYMRELSYKCK